jgi:hypothetical protein
MADTLENKLVDKRVVHRYVKKGRVDEKEYEQHVKKLPDLADQAVAIESEIEPGEGDDEE